MAKLPKGFRTNINIKPTKIGLERREEILEGIESKGTFLPKGVDIESMDQTFVEYLNSDKGLSITIDENKVPVIFLTIQRWSEFSQTWQFADKYKNIELPFITIVRKPDIQEGQNQAGLWNIPGNRTYTYMKVPTWDGTRKGIDLYKVPQPTPVDISYEVRLFSNRMKDLNKFSSLMRRTFQSRQSYITVNGHPMPLHLENTGDESQIEDLEGRRFYVLLFEIKLLGYILDENDFEVVPTVNRTMITTEVEETTLASNILFEPHVSVNGVTFTFDFKPKSEPQFNFINQYNISFTQLVDVINISRITINVNGSVVFDGTILSSPIIFNANDTVNIKVTKGFFDDGIFKLMGNTI